MPMAPSPLQRLVQFGTTRRLAARLAKRLDARLHGGEHVPRTGPALLVGNHALFGADSGPFCALLAAEVGRVPRWLGERNLWRIPGLAPLLDAVGAIPGRPDDAVKLLEAGELVCVYPGGFDDSSKLTTEAYTLFWRERAGFARVALRARAPIVPFASTGVDELFIVRRREHLIGRRLFGSPRYDVPIPENLLPRRVPLDYRMLPKLEAVGDATDAVAVERLRSAAFEAVDGVLRGARERLGVEERASAHSR